jgi:hypothetical protein
MAPPDAPNGRAKRTRRLTLPPAACFNARGIQKIALNTPITTRSPMMKMMRTAHPIIFNMRASRLAEGGFASATGR